MVSDRTNDETKKIAVLILVVLEYGLRLQFNMVNGSVYRVLILVVMEYGLRLLPLLLLYILLSANVLILVVMEYGLRH